MKKIAIPAILAATILVAGVFAYMPIQQANTVHLTIIAALTALLDNYNCAITPAPTTTSVVLTGADDAAVAETFAITNTAGVGVDFSVIAINIATAGVDDLGDDLTITAFSTSSSGAAGGFPSGDLIPAVANITEEVLSFVAWGNDLASTGPAIVVTTLEDVDDGVELGTQFTYTVEVCGFAAGGGALAVAET